MKRPTLTVLAVTTTLAATTALAQNPDRDMLEMAATSGCTVCHQLSPNPEVPVPLAPSYQEVAARYQNQDDVHDYLVDRVLHGTIYKDQNWEGAVNMRFMPPNVNLSRQDAAALVDWILNLEVDPEITRHLAVEERALALAATSGCLDCHHIEPLHDSRAIPLAPSFQEIATLYEGHDAKDYLLDSVLHGTLNKPKVWENVNMRFMPASVALRQEDATVLVDWILDMAHQGVELPPSVKVPEGVGQSTQ